MNTPAAPATAYQFYLVSVCGHSLRRGPSNVWELRANPDRLEIVPGTRVGHIPYADENAADDFAEAFEAANPVYLGPVAKGIDLERFRRSGDCVRDPSYVRDWREVIAA
jgi:hypothetical protein